MFNRSRVSRVVFCTVLIASLGCRSKDTTATPKAETKPNEGPVLAPPQQPAPAQGDHTSLPTEGNSGTTEAAVAAKIRANLASLSVDDRALAERQKICPVSNEPLGGMGAPKKIKVAGHDVFICCPACEDPLTKGPAKYLAKIGLKAD